MIGNKKIIKDPFIEEEIELTKVGETSRHAVGECIVDTIYEDSKGNYYIDTWCTWPQEPEPMMFLRKTLIDEIKKISKEKDDQE